MTNLALDSLDWVEDASRSAPFDGPEVVRVWDGMASGKLEAKAIECDDGQVTLISQGKASRYPTLELAKRAAFDGYRRKVSEPIAHPVREAESAFLGDVVWLLTDEDLRHIAESKDVASCRYRIKDALLIALRRLPIPAEGTAA